MKSIRDSDEYTMKGKFLTFYIEEETFGIEIIHVMEIIGVQPITKMPKMPHYIKGIVNLRGRIIPLLDVGLRFNKPQIIYNDRTCIIVIDLEGILFGLIVDKVSDVLSISKEDIIKNPEFQSNGRQGYIKSIGKIGEQVILLIDCKKLINKNDFTVI